MEAVALGEVIKTCIDITSTLLVEEGSRLYWLRHDIEWLEREMRRIQSFLEAADKRPSGKPVEMSLRKDIRDLAYDVEDIVDTYFPYIASSHRRKKGFFGRLKRVTCYLSHCYTHHCLSMEIEGIKRRIEDISRAQTTYGNLGSSSSEGIGQAEESDPRPVFLHADEPNVVIGFEKDMQKLEAKLLSNNENSHDVVLIVGMPGLGKTTLAKKVFNSVKSHFECSALVYVSQEPNIKAIFRNIAMQAGLGKEMLEENMEANLIQFLREKRYVILFDDVWTTETWDHLKMIIPNNSENGGVAILTSRSSMVGRYAGGESSLHELAPLNPDNSWDLFTKLVMSGAPSESELEDIGRKVVEKCGGVPLAIVVTVGLLRSRERTELEWKGVLDRMGQDQEDMCSKILALSYNDLPLSMKPCFLYFGLLPEDHEISALELINFWAAEKFIKATRKRTLEEVGEDYLKDLVSRNLIQVVRRRYDGSIKTCRIHDLLHALCITLAEEGNSNFFETSSNLLRPNILTSVRRVTTHRSTLNEYLSLDHQTPKLRAFLSFDNKYGEEVNVRKLGTFLGQFRFLRVLVISLGIYNASPGWFGRKTYNTIRQSCFRILYSGDDEDDPSNPFTYYLPSEIGNLIHLSYLKLDTSGCKLMFPPTMSNLKNLMTFDVEDCYEVWLPISIWKMKELRHIYFCGTVHFYTQLLKGCRVKDTKSIPVDLPNLQTLSMRYDMVPKELFKLNSLRTLRCSLYSDEAIEVLSNAVPMSDKLQELFILWDEGHSPSIRFDLSRYHNLCTFKLENKIEKLPTFPPNLTKLTLWLTELEEDPMETLGKLPKLKTLTLREAYSGKRVVCSGAGSFPQLHKLKLELDDLEELIVGEGGMPRLNKFVVTRCDNLVQVSPTLLANVATVIYEREDVTQLKGFRLPRWMETITSDD